MVLFLIAIPPAHEMEVNVSNPVSGEREANTTGTRRRAYSSPAWLPGWLRVSRPAIVARHEVRRAGQAQSVPTDMNVVATIKTVSVCVKHRLDVTPIFHESMVEAGAIAPSL